MADQEKKRRSNCLSNFTKSVNNFNKLNQDAAPIDLITTAYQKVQSCYDKLESAQDAFIEVTDIDIDTHADGIKYLDEPAIRHQNVLAAYSNCLKRTITDKQGVRDT